MTCDSRLIAFLSAVFLFGGCSCPTIIYCVFLCKWSMSERALEWRGFRQRLCIVNTIVMDDKNLKKILHFVPMAFFTSHHFHCNIQANKIDRGRLRPHDNDNRKWHSNHRVIFLYHEWLLAIFFRIILYFSHCAWLNLLELPELHASKINQKKITKKKLEFWQCASSTFCFETSIYVDYHIYSLLIGKFARNSTR